MAKKLLTVLLSITLLACISGITGTTLASAAQLDTDVRENIAVVCICFETLEGGEMGLSQGTCFFVGNTKKNVQYLVTNYHVISNFIELGAGDIVDVVLDEDNNLVRVSDGTGTSGKSGIRIYFDSPESKNYEEAYVVDYHEQKDIALLKLDSPTDKRKALKLCSPSDDMVGSMAYAAGYPGLADNPVADSTSKWGIKDATITSGTISRIFKTKGSGVKNIQIDIVINHGNSGGPLVNQKGSAIGINTWAYKEQNYAINIDEMITMLNTNNIEYEMEKNTPSLNIPIIIIAVLVVLAIIVIIIVVIKKKTPSKKQKAKPSKKEEKQDFEKLQTDIKKPIVRSMAAQHNGLRFNLDGKQIFIGRNTSVCAIVFKEGTPGVSNKHCSLSFDSASGDFILVDLNSTYGTFLSNGQKLVAGTAYHLKPRESFYLGDNINTLYVELE